MKTRKATKIEVAEAAAGAALFQLKTLAETDPKALETLARILEGYVRFVNARALAKNAPEHYGRLIRRSPQWFGFISPDSDCVKSHQWFVERLKVGSESGLNFQSKKQWSRKTPEIRAALKLINDLDHVGGLPPLTKATALQWWKAARPYFENRYGKNFEEHNIFQHYKAKGKEDSLKEHTSRRKQIVGSMAQAFRSIARNS